MRAVRAGARALGQDVLKRQYYSPVPHPEDLPSGVFERRDPLHGIDLDLDKQLALLRELEPHIREFDPPDGFFENIMYGALDAEFLYSIVRKLKPKRIIELGSGHTSVVMASACSRNGEEGSPAQYRAFDPFPPEFVTNGLEGLQDVHRMEATKVDEAEFAALDANDILFVDTTHTVKLGSEVNRIVLDLLPTLATGVRVHFHDVFLPYEYPREYLDRHLFFAEQYLLQAFLAFNPHYEVLLAAQALNREHREAVCTTVPRARDHLLPVGPSSFWISCRG